MCHLPVLVAGARFTPTPAHDRALRASTPCTPLADRLDGADRRRYCTPGGIVSHAAQRGLVGSVVAGHSRGTAPAGSGRLGGAREVGGSGGGRGAAGDGSRGLLPPLRGLPPQHPAQGGPRRPLGASGARRVWGRPERPVPAGGPPVILGSVAAHVSTAVFLVRRRHAGSGPGAADAGHEPAARQPAAKTPRPCRL